MFVKTPVNLMNLSLHFSLSSGFLTTMVGSSESCLEITCFPLLCAGERNKAETLAL